MARALVVAAHGSHYNPATALPAWECVDAIRQTGLYDEVTAAFWKEQPPFGTVLESLRSRDVTVVPLFSSQGYFSEGVLPSELQPRSDQHLRITGTVGQHRYFFDAASRSIETGFQTTGWDQTKTAVVVVGHGTKKRLTSKDSTETQARLLAESGLYAEVLTAYLDETPYIHDIYEAADQPSLVILPFFIAGGLHTQSDIPAALGLDEPHYQPQVIRNRRVIYLPPVGLEADLYKVVLDLAGENPDTPLSGTVWDSFPDVPDTLLAGESLGDIWLGSPDYLCHKLDKDTAPQDLAQLETPLAIRATLRFDGHGNFRPLASRGDLPRGWSVLTPDIKCRRAALETIYPALGAGGAEPRSVRVVGQRQRGKYRPAAGLEPARITMVAQKICSDCIQQPLWLSNVSTPSEPGCIEPCSIWLEESIR